MRCIMILLFSLFLTASSLAQSHIAPTEPLAPAEALKTFTVPEGFAVQLVAAEPDIGKPIQMAFDGKNRLWITTSQQYPFPAAEGEPARDKIYILSDFDTDGRAKSISCFADDLNIPIGILPLPDGRSCLVSEVGRIVKKIDTSGDGKADRTEVLLTGFGSRDTHGMMNSFVLLPDGWVHACHGFANESKVVGTDGSTIRMQSGNTFRFRLDGSRVENWTFGQVNPFGMTFDPNYHLYTADCHSKPITQLIRGSYYSSFGKPHDGLGYGPHVTQHDHGSTALCGLSWYQADYYPPEYNGRMFLGNVVTNRINSDVIEFVGSSPVAKKQPDFLTSSDLWFRPTDVKLGLDGALYVADFYNAIIGHYEVDLRHPKRDKHRGRIYRIVRTAAAPKPPFTDVAALDQEALQAERKHPNLVVRHAVLLELARRGEAVSFRPQHGTADVTPTADRARAEAWIGQPDVAHIPELLAMATRHPAEDAHLQHVLLIALRNCLRLANDLDLVVSQVEQNEAQKQLLLKVINALNEHRAAAFLSRRFAQGDANPAFAYQIGRYGNDDDATRVVNTLANPTQAAAVVPELIRGLQARGGKLAAATQMRLQHDCETALEAALPSNDEQTITAVLSVAASAKLTTLFPRLLALAEATSTTANQRTKLYEALLQIDAARMVPSLAQRLTKGKQPEREQAAAWLGTIPTPEATTALADALTTAPSQFATRLAMALAQSPRGSEALLQAVKQGKAPALLLQERALAAKLSSHEGGRFQPILQELTKGLPAPSAAMEQLLRERAVGFRQATTDLARGKAVFATHCANCHELGGTGAKIGPQLDGIGNRGLERLIEDTLNPSLNVDAEFRTTIVTTIDGRTISGLLLREEGEVLILSDQQGKEVRIMKADVEQRKTSAISPMPANFDTAMKPEEYYDLLAYLLAAKPSN